MPENTQETRTALEEAAYHKLNKSVGEGTVVRVVGPVVDVKFDGQVPGIYTALIREKTPLDSIDFALMLEKPQLMAFSKRDRQMKMGGSRL